MSKIKEITPKAPSSKFLVVETNEEFGTLERAEERLVEIEKIKESRAKDFLIAEKLFGHVKINFCGDNCLVKPHIPSSRYTHDDEYGWKEGRETSGILWSSMSDDDWTVPKYEKRENSFELIVKLSQMGKLESTISDSTVFLVWSRLSDNSSIEVSLKREVDSHWIGYPLTLALKELAYKVAQIL